MRKRDTENRPTDGFSRRLPLSRRRLLEALGAGSVALAATGGATLAAGQGGGDDGVEVKEVSRREPHETTNSGDDSTVAIGPKSRTYEAFTVTPGELADESSGRATDLVRNEVDGEVIEVGTEFDGLGFTDSLRDTDGDGEAEFGLVPGDPQVAVGGDRALAAIKSDIAVFDLANGREVFQVRLEDLFRPVLPPAPCSASSSSSTRGRASTPPTAATTSSPASSTTSTTTAGTCCLRSPRPTTRPGPGRSTRSRPS